MPPPLLFWTAQRSGYSLRNMTLITNEIHILDGFKKTVLVLAADRRISKRDGSFDSMRRKLFEIPYLDAYVSYFGLAKVRAQYLSDWLPAFIRKNSDARCLKDFSFRLRDELNKVVPASVLRANASGFHICGYNAAGFPEFWYLTNIGGMDQFRYTDLQPQYALPSSDFLERDARKLDWDGLDPKSVRNGIWIYRNGDFRAHVAAWEKLNRMLGELLAFPDFWPLRTPEDLAKWVKFKLEVIAHFYRKFAAHQIIGRPIDVFSLSKQLP